MTENTKRGELSNQGWIQTYTIYFRMRQGWIRKRKNGGREIGRESEKIEYQKKEKTI